MAIIYFTLYITAVTMHRTLYMKNSAFFLNSVVTFSQAPAVCRLISHFALELPFKTGYREKGIEGTLEETVR
jgi:hypothetical protein